MLTLVLISDDSPSRAFILQSNRLTKDEINDYVQLFEMFLCFDAVLTTDAISWVWSRYNAEEQCNKFNVAVAVMLNNLKKVAPRQDGNGWCIPKFHELMHLAEAVTWFGPPNVFCTSRPEHNHKHHAKAMGEHAIKTYAGYMKSVGLRVHERLTIDIAMQRYSSRLS